MLFILLLFLTTCVAKAGPVDNGAVVTLAGIPYYVGSKPIGQISKEIYHQIMSAQSVNDDSDFYPLTVFETSASQVESEELANLTAQYDIEDDVFQPAFLYSIYIRSIINQTWGVDISRLGPYLDGTNTSLLMSSGNIAADLTGRAQYIPPLNIAKGPYFVSTCTGGIFKAHRLYNDDYLAFVQGVVSDEAGAFKSLPAVLENVMAKSIAVPSRLYYTATPEQPLAGLRFGVKDIFHVKGVGTSGGSRAYFYLYGTQNATAPSVQRLIDLGAVLVGKMGTVQFANGDRPTADWVDLHAAFNPRGDGYQIPGGSSTGPGAGVAAYEWLDLAVGSDTGGSMRGPAGANGIFGNRPSTGAISMDHVIPLSPVSDTAGIFARSGSLWAKVTQVYYETMASNYTSYPSKIYRMRNDGSGRNSAGASEEVLSMVDDWILSLESFLQVKSTAANYTELWSSTHEADTDSLADMLYLTYGTYVSHDQWRLLGKPFLDDYAAVHDGRQPFINPGPLSRWRYAQANVTEEIYAQALFNISTFTTWWETEGYGRSDPESCSEGLYTYIWGNGLPSYRNQYTAAPTGPPFGLDDWAIANFAGVPEIVVPIGEVPYNSTVSMQIEYLPVTVVLRMARGCDYVLASLVDDLEQAGLLRPVATGPRLYT
ncbi:hypothetical protein PFICI_08081 [Pestalotiopsis fici W106-1]|uniref:Uncharacterized protein n=1 Tax=Pestalotiopsis fici (strain W106-1 / CGMCC3.15140) TaxID=1229662 RepID=W3X556_PESFW|nr:uncharacterized protein PFICI_08081 [Pestalotiopsis fici W106-1]ETS80552.1 hypothetical protein PFICI_08081 [Pestalotiopsis fici W106-1]